MDGHAVIGGADTLGEAARLTWGLLLLSGCCLHSIGSFLRGGGFDIVVVGYHLFLWGVCSLVLAQSKAGDFGLILFFPLSPPPRSCVLPCLTLDTFSRSLPLASRPGVFHAKVAVTWYLAGCGIQFYAALCFSRLQILSHKYLIKSRFCVIIQVTI